MSPLQEPKEIRPGKPRPHSTVSHDDIVTEGRGIFDRPPTASYIFHGDHGHGRHYPPPVHIPNSVGAPVGASGSVGPATPGALMAAVMGGAPPTPGAMMAAALAGTGSEFSGHNSPLNSRGSLRANLDGLQGGLTMAMQPVVPMYPMTSAQVQASQTLTMGTKHKHPRELSPIKQRAMQFRTGINKRTMWMQPDFSSMSVVQGALDYSLPPPSVPNMLTPSLIADLRQSSAPPTGVTQASQMGTFTAPTGNAPRLFSNTSKLPFHSSTAGPAGAGTQSNTGTNLGSMSQTMLLLTANRSQEDIHNYEVPPTVKTGLDAVKLFASSAAKDGLIVFCNLNPASTSYNPYDLVVVERGQVDPNFFYILAQTGVTHMWGGVAYELTPHHEWIRDAELFSVLKKLVMFKKRSLFMAFRKWHATVRSVRFLKHQRQLGDTLLVLSPTFGQALLRIRRMALAAWEDPSGSWKQRQLPGGKVSWELVSEPQFSQEDEAVTYDEARMSLEQEAVSTDVSDGGNGNMGVSTSPFLEPKTLPSPQVMASSASLGTSRSASPLRQPSQLLPVNSIGARAVGSTSMRSLDQGVLGRTFSSPGPPPHIPAESQLASTGSQQQGGLAKEASEGGPALQLLKQLLQKGEVLPEHGLAAQLGHIGGHTDTYTLKQFKKLRADAKSSVQASLSQMIQFVVSQVLSVGAAVGTNLSAASAAVARPTKREARAKKFEYVPAKEAWKHRSPALAREADVKRALDLQAARWDRDKMPAFVTLADSLMLTAMSELARLSLATALHQLFLPRRLGLFMVSGYVQPPWPEPDEDLGIHGEWSYAGTSVAYDGVVARGQSLSEMMFSKPSAVQLPGLPRQGTGTPGSRPPVLFQPSIDELGVVLTDLVRDVLAVTAQAALGLGSHPEIRSVMKELLGSTRAIAGTRASGPEGLGGGRAVAVVEQLRASLDSNFIVDTLTSLVEKQYLQILRHFNLRSYVGHEAEWHLVYMFDAEEYRAANYLPDKLQSDLMMVKSWMEDLARHRTTSVHGLLHFDMAPTRAALMPQVSGSYQVLMTSLTTHMMTLLKDLQARLARYISRLRNRPSELPEFVAHTEATWPHLEESGFKRQRIMFMQEHLERLYQIIKGSMAKPEQQRKTTSGVDGRPDSPDNETVVVPEVELSVRDVRPVHMAWKQVQMEVARYLEEASAAADFFQHSSALMNNHLKNNMLQVESDLLQLLQKLRLGISTSAQSRHAQVAAELEGMDQQLVQLAEQQAKCTSWAKLLTQSNVAQVLKRVEVLSQAANSAVANRKQLWQVLSQWEAVCDQLYSQPCTKHTAGGLLPALQPVLTELAAQVEAIKVTHVSEDVSDTTTSTPQEAKLAAHFALVVQAWRDMLPYAQRLCEEGVRPRHIHILLAWLKIHHAPVDNNHIADVVLSDRFMAPAVHVSNELHHVPQPNVPKSHRPAPEANPFAAAEAEAEDVTFAQLLSFITESPETRALADRALEVAAAEHRLLNALEAVKQRVVQAEVEFSAYRTFGAFVIINGPEVLSQLASADTELASVRASPYFGGVMAEFEVAEQLVAWVMSVMAAALRCQERWMFLCSLMANQEVASTCGEAGESWESLAAVWRKFMISAKEHPVLPQCAIVLQEVEVLEEALAQVAQMTASSVLPGVRAAYPRMYFASDQAIMDALALCHDVSLLPASLLSACFQGLQSLVVAGDDAFSGATSPGSTLMSPMPVSPGAMSPGAASIGSGGGPLSPAWMPQEVVSVVGGDGEVMEMMVELVSASGKTLASFLADLEAGLRTSVKAHTKACMEACGQMQVEKWAAAFPTQSVLLIDSMVWTQAVTGALTHLASGERGALRNLCDQSVLRLETLARQLRAASGSVLASQRAASAAPGRTFDVNEAANAEFGLARQMVRGLQNLIALGVAHRQVVEGLLAEDVNGPDSFEWLRQVRHYWDGGNDILYVAFAQTRLPYGWEYVGHGPDVGPLVLPMCTPGLLAAVNALQTSPVVGLSLTDSQGSCRAAVCSLARLVGKHWVGVELTPDTTDDTTARILAGTLASDCWLALDGAHNLTLQALSNLGQQLHAVWSAFYYGMPSVSLPGAPMVVPSPWVRASQADAAAPASLFVSLPNLLYLAPAHDAMLGPAHVKPAQLSETLRRFSRVVTLASPDLSLVLEAGLRCLGLRDAAEAARSVTAVMRLAAMQLPPRPQYRNDLLTVYSLLASVTGGAAPAPAPSGQASAPGSAQAAPTKTRVSYTGERSSGAPTYPYTSALDAMEAGLRTVVVGSAEPDDVPLLTSLIDQAMSSAMPRMPGAPDAPSSAPATPLRPSMLAAASPQAMAGTTHAMHQQHYLPSPTELRAALDKLLGPPKSSVAANSGSATQPLRKEGSRLVPLAEQSAAALVGPQRPSQGVLLGAANRAALSTAVSNLASILQVSGSVILVGRPGIGKSTVWKTLALATATASTLSSGKPTTPKVVHIFPETLPLPRSILPEQPTVSGGQPAPEKFSVEEWPDLLLNHPSEWQLSQGRLDTTVLPVPVGASGPPPSRAQVHPAGESGPHWLVLDGPLGTPACESLAPLLVGRALQRSSCVRTVLGVQQVTKIIWEASSLVAASPVLLSAAPVLCVSNPVIDQEGAAVQEKVQAAVRRLAGSSTKALGLLSRAPTAIITAAISKCAPILSGSPSGSRLAAGVEHGSVMLSCAARSTLTLFTEVVAGLDTVQGASAAAQVVLARAALYALYWSLAALPLEPAQRAAIEAALKESAQAADMAKALPRGGSIGAFLLGPKAGDWCPWTAALGPIMETRHNLFHPLQNDPQPKAGLTSQASRWHMFSDPLTGQLRFFVPNGLTVALQHVAALSLRAGAHPVVVGSAGSGRSTLLRHLLATGEVAPQTRTDVVGVALSPLTQPGELSEMVSWRLTTGANSQHARPTLGHRLVVLVEDLSAVAQAHTPVEPSFAALADGQGAGVRAAMGSLVSVAHNSGAADVVPPCLEWLRQLLDTGTLTERYAGSFKTLKVQGVTVAATSRVSYLVSGTQQVSARTWRHLHPLHLNAAAAADLASTLQASSAGGAPILTTFSRPALLNAVSHYTLLQLATGTARVPELLAIGPAGVARAAKVLAIGLEKLMSTVQHLVRAHLLPHAWHFGTAGMLAITERLRMAAEHQEPGTWRITDVVQRLMFEAGREVANGVADEHTRVVLSQVLLHGIGRELGALMTGKFEPVIRTHQESMVALGLAAPVPPRASASDGKEGAAPMQGSSEATPVANTPAVAKTDVKDEYSELVGLWHNYMSDLEGTSLTSLRVSLLGKLSPSDIDKLLSVVLADLTNMAGIVDFIGGGNSERSENAQQTAVHQDRQPTASTSLLQAHKGWPAWLHRLPVPQHLLHLRVAALAGMKHLPPPLGRRLTRPDTASIDRDTQWAGNEPETGEARHSPQAASPMPLPLREGSVSIVAPEGDSSTSRLPTMMGDGMDQVTGELCLHTLHQWEYASVLASASHLLVEGYYCGGHLLLSGGDPHTLLHVAQMAAFCCEAQVLQLTCPPHGQSDRALCAAAATSSLNGGMVSTPLLIAASAREASMRQQLLQLLSTTFSGQDDDDTFASTSPEQGDFWSAAQFDKLSQPPSPITGPDAERQARNRPQLSGRYVLVIGDEVAAEEGVLELLQQLVSWPGTVAHLEAAAVSDMATRNFKTQVSKMVLSDAALGVDDEEGEEGGGSTADRGLRRQASWGRFLKQNSMRRAVSNTRSPPNVSLLMECLRGLLANRSMHLRRANSVFDDSASENTVIAGANKAGWEYGASLASPTHKGRRDAIEQATTLTPAIAAAAAAAKMSKSGRMSLDEALGLALSRVEAKREADEEKARLACSTVSRVLRRLRIVLALSPAVAASVRLRFPQLAKLLATVTVPRPSEPAQIKAAQNHIEQAAAAGSGALLDNSVPPHPENCVSASTDIRATQKSDGAKMAQRILSEAGQLAGGGSAVAQALNNGTHNAGQTAQYVFRKGTDGLHGHGSQAAEIVTETQQGPPPASDERAEGAGASAAHEDDSRGPVAAASAAGFDVGVWAEVAAVARLETDREAAVRALAKVLVHIHNQAEKLLWQQGLLPAGMPLPQSKVGDMLEVLARLHGAQRKLLRSQQASLWVALQKVGRGAAAIAHGSGDVPALLDAIEARSLVVEEQVHKLGVMRSYRDELAQELERQEALVAENNAVVAQVTAEVDEALDAAQRRYRQALQEVGGLSEGDLAEMRSYTHPPELVRLVVMAVGSLFNVAPDWRSCQRMLGEQSPKLLERLVAFDPRSITLLSMAKLHRIISEPDFNIVQVGQVSQAARPLCWWVLSVAELIRVGKEADLKRSKVAEAEQRLEAAHKYVRKLRGELRAARNEEARRTATKEAAEADIAEMRALIRDAELAASNVRRLGTVVGKLTAEWEAKLKVVESQLPTLLGDATLGAAAVVYLGPLLPTQRAAALGAWRQVLEANGVAVDPHFELRKFMQNRERQHLAPMARDIAAAAPAAWREAMVLMGVACRPPLLLDCGREAGPLIKALHGGKTSQRVFITTQDEAVADKVANAVAMGKVVFLDLLSVGDAAASAASVVAASAEARVLSEVVVKYEGVMREMFSNRGTARHQLYLRLRSTAAPLMPLLHGLVTPVRFGYESPELEMRMLDTVLQHCASQETVVQLHELVTQEWEVVQAEREVGDRVVFSMAHTRGPVFADTALVDATSARCEQQDQLARLLPELQKQLKSLEDLVRSGQRSLLDAAHVAHDCLLHLAAQDTRAMMPDHIFLHIVRTAARAALQHSEQDQDGDESEAPTSPLMSTYASPIVPPRNTSHPGAHLLAPNTRYKGASTTSSRASSGRAHDPRTSDSTGPTLEGSSDEQKDLATAAAAALKDKLVAKGSPLSEKRARKSEDMFEHMLVAMCEVLTMSLCSSHAAVLRLLLGLHAMARRREISSDQLHFTMNLLRLGPPTSGGKTMPPGSTAPQPQQSIAAALMAGGAGGANGGVSQGRRGASDTKGGDGFAAPAAAATAWPSPAQQADLVWLERSFPGQTFVGISAAMAAAPAAWKAALWDDDLSRPAAVAAAAAAAAKAGASGRSRLADDASLTSLVVALGGTKFQDAAQAGATSHGGSASAAAAAAASSQGGASEASGSEETGPSNTPASEPSLLMQATALHLGPGSLPPVGPLPEHWAATRLRSPLHWFLLAALLAPGERLAPAAEWLSNLALRAPPPTLSPGERVLLGVLPLPAATPVLLATCGTEDVLAAVYGAQAAIVNGATRILEVPARSVRLGERDVVVQYWDSAHFRDIKSAMARAMRHGQWLLLLNVHTAPPSQLLELMELLSGKEYMLRGEEVGFRLLLSLPFAALPSLPGVVRHQGITVVVEPPGSLAAHVRGVMQLLAHPISSYISYFAKPGDRELQVAGFGVALAVGVLGRTLASTAAPGAPTATPFGWWDVLHAVHLVRLVVGEARKYDPGLESHPLDYGRLRELLLADVFLPACPAQHLTPHAAAVVKLLLVDSALTYTYPVHLLSGDRDADAAVHGVYPTEPWPFHVLGLKDVLTYIARLMEPDLADFKPDARPVADITAEHSPAPQTATAAAAAAGALAHAHVSPFSMAKASLAHGHSQVYIGPPQSLAGGGRWPLATLLRYRGASQAAGWAAQSLCMRLHMARMKTPMPATAISVAGTQLAADHIGASKPAHSAAPTPDSVLHMLMGGTPRPSVPGTPASTGSAGTLLSLGGAAVPMTETAVQAVARVSMASAPLLPPPGLHRLFSKDGEAAGIQAWLGTLSQSAPSLSALLSWVSSHQAAAQKALAVLSARLKADLLKPRGLISSWDTLGVEAMAQEARFLASALTSAARTLSHLVLVAANPFAVGSEVSAAAGHMLNSGLVPVTWHTHLSPGMRRGGRTAVPGAAPTPLPLRAWQELVESRSALVRAAAGLDGNGNAMDSVVPAAPAAAAPTAVTVTGPRVTIVTPGSQAAGTAPTSSQPPAGSSAPAQPSTESTQPAAVAAVPAPTPAHTTAPTTEAATPSKAPAGTEASTAAAHTPGQSAAMKATAPTTPAPTTAPVAAGSGSPVVGAVAMPAHVPGLWIGPLDLGSLALPLAPIAVLARAHAIENCVHIASVACRVLPTSAAPTVSQQLGAAGSGSGASTAQAPALRRVLPLAGMWVFDASLLSLDPASTNTSDVLQIGDVGPGTGGLSIVRELVVSPVALDPRSRAQQASRQQQVSSRGGCATPSATATAGSMVPAMMPGVTHSLTIPLALTPLGALAGEAMVGLQVDARAPFLTPTPQAASSASAARAAPPRSRSGAAGSATVVRGGAVAAPNARALCFVAASPVGAWAQDPNTLRLVAKD